MNTESAVKVELKRTFNHSSEDILFSLTAGTTPDEVIVGSSDAGLYALNLADEKPVRTPFTGAGHSSYVTGVVHAAGQVISGAYDGQLCWWNAAERTSRQVVAAHDKWIRQLALSPGGDILASVADDMQCRLWQAETGQPLQTLLGHELKTPHHYPSMLYAVAWSPDGIHLATADKTGQIIIWDAAAGTIATRLEAAAFYTWDPRARRHSIGGIRSLAFSPDGRLLAVGGMGHVGNIDHLDGPARVELFDWKSGEKQFESESAEFKGLVEAIVFSPDGTWLATGGGNHKGFVMLLETASGKSLAQESQDTHVHALLLREDGRQIVSAGYRRLAGWSVLTAENPPAEPS